jgi:hypothetical protein
VVSVLVIVLEVLRVQIRSRTMGFLRAIKIRSTTPFVGELQPSVPSDKILRHVKGPYSMKEIIVG